LQEEVRWSIMAPTLSAMARWVSKSPPRPHLSEKIEIPVTTAYAPEESSTSPQKPFWEHEACGGQLIGPTADARSFYARYTEFRYYTSPHIPDFVDGLDARGRDVLEIGCGNGADGARLAERGAKYVGVDLTETAIGATREHFQLRGLRGRFRLENAERLSFNGSSFDAVYSFGVLHHTPHPERAVAEIRRVLRPGGTARVMLYHKHSFNYWVRIVGYMRLRVLVHILRRVGRWSKDRERLDGTSFNGLRNNQDASTWEAHYRNWLQMGWSYLRPSVFVHRCTDGPGCPIAFVYSRRAARKHFAGYATVTFQVAHLPLRKYAFLKRVPRRLERWIAGRIGFHLLITATK
jgi:SAM-dependent methyltransferase